MKTGSHTLPEAQASCDKFQYLEGKPFDAAGGGAIDCAAIGPAERLSQWLFAHFYLELGCPVAALSFYRHDRYDVIVLSGRGNDIYFRDIRTYLEEQWQEPLDPITTKSIRPSGAGNHTAPM